MGLRGGRQRRWRSVLRADQSRQWRLLDLQAFDTRLDQITHARASLPQHKELVALQERARTLDTDLVNARTALGDTEREVDKAEADVQLVRDRAARDRAHLDAGSGTAKDLQALQHEVQSLARRQSELEEVELEVMERVESLQGQVSGLEAAQVAVQQRLDEVTATRDAAVADLDAEAERVSAQRSDAAAVVGEDLVALYEKIRVGGGGIGAAALTGRRCGGCRLELNQVDMDRIKAAPDDEVLRCEQCRRILVRTPESGR